MNDQATSSRPSHPKSRAARRPRRVAETPDQYLDPQTPAAIRAAIRGCARCSYLLAGYQALYGVERLEAALAHNRRNWLHLEWANLGDLLRLLDDHYGYRLLYLPLHFEGLCDECRRAFVYHDPNAHTDSAETPDAPHSAETSDTSAVAPPATPFTLRLQILPRLRQ